MALVVIFRNDVAGGWPLSTMQLMSTQHRKTDLVLLFERFDNESMLRFWP